MLLSNCFNAAFVRFSNSVAMMGGEGERAVGQRERARGGDAGEQWSEVCASDERGSSATADAGVDAEGAGEAPCAAASGGPPLEFAAVLRLLPLLHACRYSDTHKRSGCGRGNSYVRVFVSVLCAGARAGGETKQARARRACKASDCDPPLPLTTSPPPLLDLSVAACAHNTYRQEQSAERSRAHERNRSATRTDDATRQIERIRAATARLAREPERSLRQPEPSVSRAHSPSLHFLLCSPPLLLSLLDHVSFRAHLRSVQAVR